MTGDESKKSEGQAQNAAGKTTNGACGSPAQGLLKAQ